MALKTNRTGLADVVREDLGWLYCVKISFNIVTTSGDSDATAGEV
jgi:hypothetical protein